MEDIEMPRMHKFGQINPYPANVEHVVTGGI